MSAVAATNVGDIYVDLDPDEEKAVIKTETHKIAAANKSFTKDSKVGEFRLGSTIVLVSALNYILILLLFKFQIFEAPEHIKFAIRAGDKLRYGQSMIVKDV